MNKSVLITGSSSGIGFETAVLFAQNGWTTLATVKDLEEKEVEKLKTVKRDNDFSNLHIVEIDVTNNKSIETGLKIIKKTTSHIDVLINNAGFGFVGPVEDFEIEEIVEQYNVNLFGSLRMIKKVAPIMREKGFGRIINVGSVNGLVTFPLYGVYSSSKFALETLTEALRFELAPHNIKVSIIEPGGFETSFPQNKKYPKKMNTKESPYFKWAPAMLKKIMESGENSKGLKSRLMNPKRVANLIYKIVNSDNPKLRYKIGFDTRLFTLARKILPYSVWKYCINRVYRWS